MRERIRDAAFVLVDLTHDNPGAYWEGGYAEGLGKPVIYICEASKFGKENSFRYKSLNYGAMVSRRRAKI